MGRPYTHEQEKWLDENVPKHDNDLVSVAKLFNERFNETRTLSSIRNRVHYLLIPTRHSKYTEEQNRWIVDHAYLDRRTMRRKFNETFGCSRSQRSIEQKCSSLKAYKVYNGTKEHKERIRPSNEIDEWLWTNARSYCGRYDEMAKVLNAIFDRSFTERAVYLRCWKLGIMARGYNRFEEEWLEEHMELSYKEIAYLFNQHFGQNRSYDSISAKLWKMKRKHVPVLIGDAKKTNVDESSYENGEITPPCENERSEVVL